MSVSLSQAGSYPVLTRQDLGLEFRSGGMEMSKKLSVLFLLMFFVCDASQAYMLCRGAGGLTTLRITCKKRETRVNPYNLSVPDQRGVFFLGGFATSLGQKFTESHSFPFQMDAALGEDKIVILSSGSTPVPDALTASKSPQPRRGTCASI